MSDNYLPDWNAELLSLAKLERDTKARIQVAQQMRQTFFDIYIAHYDDEIAALNNTLAQRENALRELVKGYVIETGDKHVHASIEVKAKPASWEYDTDEILEVAKREGLSELVRVKEELNKIELNKALKANQYPFLPATPAPADFTISIRPLGDLLIIAEMNT